MRLGNAPEAATKYFNSIMQETRTHIAWPSRLKLGAKSKKDPHIRIIGRLEDVKKAREKIASSLDTKGNRVNMKIDVSYTDHSHIIGKGGLTIKKVMEDTACHIHFPDSNRNNPTEKSNQVSIAGEVWGVERARAKVRELTPLIFCFELPILGAISLASDSYSTFIKSLQETYNVQVMFRTRQKLNSTLVVVKGCEWEVARVKEATQLLYTHMCETLTDQVSVHMMVEISPQHHSIVLGKNNETIKNIMQNTSTQIIFPDPSDPNIPSLKKSNVTITGCIHNVYKARQQLIGSLPVVLMFDVPENSIILNAEQISDLMSKLDVIITVRQKPKQNVISFILKGIERNVKNIYEARRKLIAPNDPPFEPEIPASYFIPNGGPLFKTSWNFPIIYSDLPSSPLTLTPMISHSPADSIWPSLPQHLMIAAQHHLPIQSYLSPHHRYHNHHHFHQQHPEHLGQFSYSSLSLPELPVYSSSNASSVSSPSVSPRTSSPIPPGLTEQYKTDNHSRFSDHVERKAPGFDRPLLTPVDYQRKKLRAYQAMQKPPNPKEVRVPNSTWFGYGFSQSSPSDALREKKLNDERKATHDWPCNGNGTGDNENTDFSKKDVTLPCQESVGDLRVSNYLDSISQSTLSTIASINTQDVYTILATFGLEKYAQLFTKHEIDFQTFRTLNENDLKEIGITTFGARRKIMICIKELNNREKNPFKGSAAPGAERKSSSNNSLNDIW